MCQFLRIACHQRTHGTGKICCFFSSSNRFFALNWAEWKMVYCMALLVEWQSKKEWKREKFERNFNCAHTFRNLVDGLTVAKNPSSRLNLPVSIFSLAKLHQNSFDNYFTNECLWYLYYERMTKKNYWLMAVSDINHRFWVNLFYNRISAQNYISELIHLNQLIHNVRNV